MRLKKDITDPIKMVMSFAKSAYLLPQKNHIVNSKKHKLVATWSV